MIKNKTTNKLICGDMSLEEFNKRFKRLKKLGLVIRDGRVVKK